MGGGDFITFLDRTQDFPKMPVFRARLSLKRMTGVPLGAEPLSPRLSDFFIFFQKMVAGEATLLGKNQSNTSMDRVHVWPKHGVYN